MTISILILIFLVSISISTSISIPLLDPPRHPEIAAILSSAKQEPPQAFLLELRRIQL